MSENIEESGAIIYVAITVLAFVFLVLVAVWIMTRRKRKRYNPVKADTEGDSVELVKNVEKKTNEFTIEEEDSEEDIELYSDNLEDPSLEAV
jgi:flagellar biosynthesis/type III secretory pathway M-ring protein FliF/YscJ